MFKEMPHAIQQTFWKYLLLYSGIGLLGLILSYAMRDLDLALLSIAVMGFGSVKAFNLCSSVRNKDFRVLEGTVISDTKLAIRNCHVLILTDERGVAHRLLLSGNKLLEPQRDYRLYLLSANGEPNMASLPDLLAPAQTVLGQEELCA